MHRNQNDKLDNRIERLEKKAEVDSSTTRARTMNETNDSLAATAVPSAPALAPNTEDFEEWCKRQVLLDKLGVRTKTWTY